VDPRRRRRACATAGPSRLRGSPGGRGSPGTGYSPLLFAANALLFALCGASDGLARLWPALFGSVLALMPSMLRQRIGRVGALAAGLYLALSPTALFASRQLDGAVVTAVGGMAFLGGLVRFLDTGRHSWLALSAVGLALAVTSSPSAYGLLLTLGLGWLIHHPQGWGGLRGGGSPWRLWEKLRPHLNRTLVVFLFSVLTFSTGLGWNLGGLGATGDLLSAWLTRFGAVSDPIILADRRTVSFPALVLVYEPLALFLGLGGLVWAVGRGHRFGALLGLWAGLGALQMALMPGWTTLDTLWVVLPLVMLTGVAVESLAQGLRERGEWLGEGLYAPLVAILWVHFYLMLAGI